MDPLKNQISDFKANRLVHAWELLRLQHHEFPAQAVTVLLYVASHDPCHKQAIEQDLGLSTASCSRMVNLLSPADQRPGIKNEGLGLIEKFKDPSNGRRLLLSLTPKGDGLISGIKTLIYG